MNKVFPVNYPLLSSGTMLALAGAAAFSLKPILIKLIYSYGINTEVLMAIEKIGSSRTSIIGSIGPIVTAVFAVMLLGEAFTVYHAAGMILTLAGVLYLGRG